MRLFSVSLLLLFPLVASAVKVEQANTYPIPVSLDSSFKHENGCISIYRETRHNLNSQGIFSIKTADGRTHQGEILTTDFAGRVISKRRSENAARFNSQDKIYAVYTQGVCPTNRSAVSNGSEVPVLEIPAGQIARIPQTVKDSVEETQKNQAFIQSLKNSLVHEQSYVRTDHLGRPMMDKNGKPMTSRGYVQLVDGSVEFYQGLSSAPMPLKEVRKATVVKVNKTLDASNGPIVVDSLGGAICVVTLKMNVGAKERKYGVFFPANSQSCNLSPGAEVSYDFEKAIYLRKWSHITEIKNLSNTDFAVGYADNTF